MCIRDSAMGGIGSDAAMESADVVLMADDLRSLPYALDLALSLIHI